MYFEYNNANTLGMLCALAMDYEAARTIFERQHKDYTFVSMEVRFSDYVDGAYIYARMRKKNTAPRRR